MSRNVFIFIWLLVLAASCDKMDISPEQADSFIKFYNTFPVLKGADVKEIPGSGYALLGTVTSDEQGEQICLIRTDLYGNSIDTARYYGGLYNDQACCLQILNDKGFAILGQISDVNNKKSIYFIRTDSVGNVLFDKTFSGTYDIEPKKLEVAAGKYYIIGSEKTNEGGAPLNKNLWLNALNETGESAWGSARTQGSPFDDEGNDLDVLPDGRIVITGTTYNSENKRHAFILRTGPIGLGGSLFILNSTVDEEAYSIQTVNANTFIIGGKTQTSPSESDIMMKKVTYSPTGLNLDWNKTYGEENDFGVCVILDENNLYQLATTSSTGINTTITLITTDPEGNNPVYSTVGEGTQLTASSFQKTADDGFIIAGTNKHSDNDQSLTLIKLKANGSLW